MGGTDFARRRVRCFSHRSVKRLTHRCVNQLEQTVCLIALCGDKVKMKAKLEYIWLDGYKPTQSLRPVVVKDCARIGSNAVVTKDVPKGGIMVGIPAKNIKTGSKKPDTSFAPYAVTKK